MKTIGMLGGMSWESTASYYRELNEGVKKTLGSLHSANIFLNSVNFEEIEKLQVSVAEKLGYQLVDHKLELYGVKKKK